MHVPVKHQIRGKPAVDGGGVYTPCIRGCVPQNLER